MYIINNKTAPIILMFILISSGANNLLSQEFLSPQYDWNSAEWKALTFKQKVDALQIPDNKLLQASSSVW